MQGTGSNKQLPRSSRNSYLTQEKACKSRRRHANRQSASVLSAFWHKYELSRRRRALEQLVRSAHFGEWQALGHDRVDLATTKQVE
jgi:hypothetical protein